MAHIVVVDGYTLNPGDNSWGPLDQFGTTEIYDRTSLDKLVDRANNAEIIITNKVVISAETMSRLPRLRFIAVTATGYNIVDVEAARSHGITVSNVPEYGTTTVAQFTWALILELCHRVGRHAQSVAAGEWTACEDFCYWLTPQVELAGKRLGLVGYGRIARRVAEIGRVFGMQVAASGRPGSMPPPEESIRWLMTEQLFAESDVISLHCPLTAENQRMVNRGLLKFMPRHAILINTSRGGLVDESDLADALRSGRIAGAAVDVASVEPIQKDNPLLSAPNCLVTPHIAWSSLDARRRIMQTTVVNIAAFLANRPQNKVV